MERVENVDEYIANAPREIPATVRKIKKAQNIAKFFFERNKPVASICHGSALFPQRISETT